jgi:hypothetical protein
MELGFLLNDILNKALTGKGRIKGVPSSNKVCDFINKYAESEQLSLHIVIVPKGTLCECNGNERIALDCTMKPCKHPKYFKG